ncbi:MAG TPA: helix-turn-helix domain-containing protein [Microthrixaceae bacterium]|nr:helix-turn-helix domain-containing protein [Microthrixaceae bacterium]
MTKSIQQQAKALGDPTRYEIFRFLADADAPVDVSGITAEFGLNHNAIRQHLTKLVDAELVIEHRGPSAGRGRPRLLYRINPSADSRWGLTGPYERLSLLLAEVVRTGDSPEAVGRRAGLAQEREFPPGTDPVEELMVLMARQGFDPAVDTDGTRVSATLRTCPFATAAAADPDTVCSLHLGMVEGLAEGIDGFVIDSFQRGEPLAAKCCVHGHVE